MVTYATWNPSDKAANIALSGGDLTATKTVSNAWNSVRSTISKSAGKHYWEVTVGDDGPNAYVIAGIATSSASLTNYAGADIYGYGYHGYNGRKYNNGSAVVYGNTFTAGDIISIALDLDAGKLWFGKNGTWQASGDPEAGTNAAYTGISGTFFAAVSPYYYSPAAYFVANFGASAFSYSVPSGFNSGLYDAAADVNVDFTDSGAAQDAVDAFSLTGIVSDSAAAQDAVDATIKNLNGVLADSSAAQDAVDGFSLTGILADSGAAQDAVSASVVWTNPAISDSSAAQDAVDGLSLTGIVADSGAAQDAASCYKEAYATAADSGAAQDAVDAFNFSQWLRENRDRMYLRYELTLTGAENGTTDVNLPMESFQTRMRTAEPTYLSVVVPNTSYSAQITARSSGQLIVDMVAYVAGTESLREEIVRVDLEGIRIDQGGKNASITLDGHKTVTYASRKTALQSVTYYRLDDGEWTYRCAWPDFYLKPGQTATYDGNEITVSQVSIVIGPASHVMEVTDG